jgi:cell division protein FtsW (lipid II flippase)
VICEEFGIIVGLCVIAFFLLLIIRGAMIALSASDRYSMLVTFGCTVILTLQSFIIIGGVIKLIPLTGITMPFVSYGGSSMISCMILIGIIEGVAVKNGEMLESALTGEAK